MNYDRQITISAANSRRSALWPQQVLYWSEFVARLQTPARSAETLQEYLSYPKSKQDDLKDVGGFVGGTFQNNRRKPYLCIGRDIITLDLDNIPAGKTADTLRRLDSLNCAYATYSTQKHEEVKPRLRVLIPLSRTSTGEEYEPLSRKLGQIIGIDLCDPTTFEVNRLMYWPSCCSDSQYIFTYGDKPFVDVDGVLAFYQDWRNVNEWPEVPHAQPIHKPGAKQEDPTAKAGIVGAFCKTYNVYQAMDYFLPGIYSPCDDSYRYTFVGGSTTGGAVIYDNGSFLYSHHATDPAGGKLVNAFDLVRLHLYHEKDDEAKPDTPINKLPSFMEMCKFAAADPGVASLLNQERYERALTDFSGLNAAGSPLSVSDVNWMSKLEVSTTGTPAKTVDNCLIILDNDPLLQGKIAYDEFGNRGLVLGSLPWDRREERRQWTDIDDAGLRHYLERVYNITGKDRVYDATALIAHKHTINDVKDYLLSLQWDGIPRLDALFTDYLGAADNIYTRAVSRKSLVAAVARAITPGVKYDYMVIFTGPAGIGKSTFIRYLGRKWFSDSLTTFEGKEAAEMLQGVWINEIPELQGFNKSEVTAVIQFLSKTDDIYREAYGRRTLAYPRKCIFFGTTNEAEFLRGHAGDRRFWPVDTALTKAEKSVFDDLPDEVDQIWAEAVHYFSLGEPLFLTRELEVLAKEQQVAHKETSAKDGIIKEFIERHIPVDWDKRAINERRLYWSAEFGRAAPGQVNMIPRYKICAAEIWTECFNKDVSFMKRSDAMEINAVIASMPGWKKTTYRFGNAYGLQKGYLKV